MSSTVLDLQYLPSVNWFVQFLKYEVVFIERYENFLKSTARNRCTIGAANGSQILSIPLQGGRDHHQLYSAVRISYVDDWQKNHWHSIKSAYGSAPYFEYYADKLQIFYDQPFELLFDFNLSLLELLLKMLKIEKEILFTSEYETSPLSAVDLRSTRKAGTEIALQSYYQVFADRNGFTSNLSIIDLIFHLGPQAKEYVMAVSKLKD